MIWSQLTLDMEYIDILYMQIVFLSMLSKFWYIAFSFKFEAKLQVLNNYLHSPTRDINTNNLIMSVQFCKSNTIDMDQYDIRCLI